MSPPDQEPTRRGLDGTQGRGRPVGPADVREAALTLFSERGYHGTSMKDIARILGIQAPSLYNHVESKQALLREIMFDAMDRLIREYDAAVASIGDVSQQLRRGMEAHVRHHATHRQATRIAQAEISSLDEPARSEFRTLRREYSRAWRDLIERGKSEGYFHTPSPKLASYAMIEMGIGVYIWFRESGAISLSQVSYYYGDMAIQLATAAAGSAQLEAPSAST